MGNKVSQNWKGTHKSLKCNRVLFFAGYDERWYYKFRTELSIPSDTVSRGQIWDILEKWTKELAVESFTDYSLAIYF